MTHWMNGWFARIPAFLVLCLLLPMPLRAADTLEAETGIKGESPRLTLDCGDGVELELARISAGTFMMGSPSEGVEADVVRQIKYLYQENAGLEYDETQHHVYIGKSFYIGIYEVTRAQYRTVMGGNNSNKFKEESFPVELVSWDDAQEFCRRLSEKTGRNVRLPTEAEWEYACRAGTTTPFNTGETINPDQANYDGNYVYGDGRKGVYREKTAPVGSFTPNAWGLYDTHGNVAEWCSDWYGYYDVNDKADPKGALSGTARVVRGGSWVDSPWGCRSAYRVRCDPSDRDVCIGFRIALD